MTFESGHHSAAHAQHQLQAISAAAQDGIVMIDEHGLVTFWSAAAERIFGYNAPEVLGRNLHEIIVPEQLRPMARRGLAMFSRGGQGAAIGKTLELPGRTKDGRQVPLELSISGMQVEGQWHALAIIRDITERKLAQEATVQSETLLRSLVDNINEGVSIFEPVDDGLDFVFKDINQRVETIEDVARADVIGRRLTEVFPGAEAMGMLACLREVHRTGEPRELPTCHNHDDRIAGWRRNYIYPLPTGELVAVYSDVTAQIEAKAILEESEARYRDLADNALDMIQSVDTDGVVIYANRAWLTAMGYTEADLGHINVFDTIHPAHREHCMEAMFEVMNGIPMTDTEVLFVGQSGRQVYVEGNVTCRMRDGKPLYTRGVFRDVTDRNEIRDTLIRSEKQYRDLVENITDMLQSVDMDGNIVYVNNAWCETMGYDASEALELNLLSDVIHPDHREECEQAMAEIFLEGRRDNVETVFLTKAGEEIHVSGSVSSSMQGCQKGLTRAIFRDVTEQWRAKQALELSERRYRQLVQQVGAMILRIDDHGVVAFANDSALDLTGQAPDLVYGHEAQELVFTSPLGRIDLLEILGALVDDMELEVAREMAYITGKRHQQWVLWTFRLTEQGDGLLCVGHDISERKRAEMVMEYDSTHDSLTGLRNRAYFDRVLATINGPFSVVMCDLDGLKQVNDTQGHQAGDALIAAAAEVLRGAFRPSDIVARLGGDEFAILLPGCAPSFLPPILDRLGSTVDGQQRVSMSIGAAGCAQSCAQPATIVEQADAAMYDNKRRRKARQLAS